MCIFTSVLVIAFFMIFSVMYQQYKIHVICSGVKDAVQNSITENLIDNYSTVYYGQRDGYTGNYVYKDGNWNDASDTSSVAKHLEKVLNLTGSDDNLTGKDNTGAEEYCISGLTISVDNPKDNTTVYKEKASFTLKIPVAFCGGILPDITTNMTVYSGFVPKY